MWNWQIDQPGLEHRFAERFRAQRSSGSCAAPNIGDLGGATCMAHEWWWSMALVMDILSWIWNLNLRTSARKIPIGSIWLVRSSCQVGTSQAMLSTQRRATWKVRAGNCSYFFIVFVSVPGELSTVCKLFLSSHSFGHVGSDSEWDFLLRCYVATLWVIQIRAHGHGMVHFEETVARKVLVQSYAWLKLLSMVMLF